MGRLFSCPPLIDFGPNCLDPSHSPATLQHIAAGRAAALRRGIRETCSRKPGVYGMLDGHGELIYVGKAKSLRARLLSYFRPRSRDPKAGRILAPTRAVVWEVSPCEFGALHRELELIRRWRPRFNVQGQPRGRQFTYVCVGRAPAPNVFLARRPSPKVLASFGPVPAGARAADAVRRVNDLFQLRDCPHAQEMIFADQEQLYPLAGGPGCLRHEIGTCLGPCFAACSARSYGLRVRKARAFLAGRDLTPLTALERDMNAAAAAQQFERAGCLRDRLTALRWLQEQLTRMRRIQSDGDFVYPACGHDGRTLWYLVRGGRTVEAIWAPSCSQTRPTAKERLKEVYRPDLLGNASLSFEHFDAVFLVASWFRRHPEQRARLLKPDEALARTSGCTG